MCVSPIQRDVWTATRAEEIIGNAMEAMQGTDDDEMDNAVNFSDDAVKQMFAEGLVAKGNSSSTFPKRDYRLVPKHWKMEKPIF